jgi:hypothetical protein
MYIAEFEADRMIGLLKRAIAHYARTTGRGTSLYKKFCKPDGYEWAQHMGRWGGLHSVGKGAWINLGATSPTRRCFDSVTT